MRATNSGSSNRNKTVQRRCKNQPIASFKQGGGAIAELPGQGAPGVARCCTNNRGGGVLPAGWLPVQLVERVMPDRQAWRHPLRMRVARTVGPPLASSVASCVNHGELDQKRHLRPSARPTKHRLQERTL